MKKKLFFTSVSAVVLLSFAIVLSAQTTPSQLFKDLQQQISTYKTDKIIPNLTKWKTQLDNAMSKDDLAKLNDLRAKATALREKSKLEMQQLRKNRSEDMEQNKEKIKELMKEKSTEFKELAEQLKPIAEKYKSTLETIGETAKPKVDTWKTDIKQIVDNWKQENKQELAQLMELPGAKEKLARFKQGMEFMQGFKKKAAVARFMLWDGKDIDITNQSEGQVMTDTPEPILVKSMVTEVSNYPNPVTDKTTISFNSPLAQNVTITLINSEGKTVGTVYKGKITSGQQSFNVDVTNLVSGNYIYKIKSDTWTKTGMMIVEK